MSQQTLFTTNSLGSEGSPIRAKIIGIGGAGLSLVDGLRLDGFDAVRTVALDIDATNLSESISSEKVSLGRRLTRGMGTYRKSTRLNSSHW